MYKNKTEIFLKPFQIKKLCYNHFFRFVPIYLIKRKENLVLKISLSKSEERKSDLYLIYVLI